VLRSGQGAGKGLFGHLLHDLAGTLRIPAKMNTDSGRT